MNKSELDLLAELETAAGNPMLPDLEFQSSANRITAVENYGCPEEFRTVQADELSEEFIEMSTLEEKLLAEDEFGPAFGDDLLAEEELELAELEEAALAEEELEIATFEFEEEERMSLDDILKIAKQNPGLKITLSF